MPHSNTLLQRTFPSFFASPVPKEENSYHTLVQLIFNNNLKDIKELIQKKKIDINIKFNINLTIKKTLYDFREVTLLHIAAIYNRLDIINFLLQEKADPNASCKYSTGHNSLEYLFSAGRTPLHLASMFESCEAIDFLCKKGANVYLRDKDGYSPLSVANDKSLLYFEDSLIEEEYRKNDKEIKWLEKLSNSYSDAHVPLFYTGTILLTGVLIFFAACPPSFCVALPVVGLSFFAGVLLWGMAHALVWGTAFETNDNKRKLKEEKCNIGCLKRRKSAMKQQLFLAKLMEESNASKVRKPEDSVDVAADKKPANQTIRDVNEVRVTNSQDENEPHISDTTPSNDERNNINFTQG